MKTDNKFGLFYEDEILVQKDVKDGDGTTVTLFVCQEDHEAYTVGTSFYSASDEQYVVESILFCQHDQLMDLAELLQEAYKKIKEGE